MCIACCRTYESNVAELSMYPFHRLTLPKAYAARNRLQKIMGAYYTAEHDLDDSAAQLTRARANAMRKWGFTGDEVGQCDSFLAIVGITNSAPMTYWLVSYVYSIPGLKERLRDEVGVLVRRETTTAAADGHEGHDVATVDLSRLEKECPLLVSCYRETLRLCNSSVSIRRVMEDTTISDGKGRSYVLKKGVDVHVPAGVSHVRPEVWGDNAAEFVPDRFLDKNMAVGVGVGATTANGSAAAGEAMKRKRKAAYIPFGGGQHLCPGRNFALAEILGFMTTVLTGFEIEATGDVPFGKMDMAKAKLSTAMRRPVEGGKGQGLRIWRRDGWENTQWHYVS
jgi:cytochrome P450